MAVAIEATVTGGAAGNVTLASWTPAADELLVVCATLRQTSSSISSVTGNGLTWTLLWAEDEGESQIRTEVWTAQGASPSSGGVTVNQTGSQDMAVQALRISGCATSSPVEANVVQNDEDVGGDSTSPSVDITTITDDAMVLGVYGGRLFTYTKGASFTLNSDTTQGSGGNQVRVVTQYLIKGTAGSQTVDGTISSSHDWIMGALAIKPSSGGGTDATPTPSTVAATGAVPAPTVDAGNATAEPSVVAAVADVAENAYGIYGEAGGFNIGIGYHATALPNGTVSSTGATVVGAASAHLALDDTHGTWDFNDYVEFDVDPGDGLEMQVATPASGWTDENRDKHYLHLRVEYAPSVGVVSQQVKVDIYSNGGVTFHGTATGPVVYRSTTRSHYLLIPPGVIDAIEAAGDSEEMYIEIYFTEVT